MGCLHRRYHNFAKGAADILRKSIVSPFFLDIFGYVGGILWDCDVFMVRLCKGYIGGVAGFFSRFFVTKNSGSCIYLYILYK